MVRQFAAQHQFTSTARATTNADGDLHLGFGASVGVGLVRVGVQLRNAGCSGPMHGTGRGSGTRCRRCWCRGRDRAGHEVVGATLAAIRREQLSQLGSILREEHTLIVRESLYDFGGRDTGAHLCERSARFLSRATDWRTSTKCPRVPRSKQPRHEARFPGGLGYRRPAVRLAGVHLVARLAAKRTKTGRKTAQRQIGLGP